MIENDVVRARAWTVPSLMLAILAWSKRVLAWTQERLASALELTKATITGPVANILAGPVKTLVLGRRSAVSIATGLLAVVLAPAVAWWVATTTGYPPIEAWVLGTWNGTDPHAIVFVWVILLVGLGTLSAAVNSGLVPTTLLVMAPLFGLAATRYGTRYTDPHLGQQVVSLPHALEFATAVAVLGGVPLAIVGFLFGEAVRRLIDRLGIASAVDTAALHPRD